MAVSIRDGGMIAKKELALRHSPDNPQFANLGQRDEHEPELPMVVTRSKMPELGTPSELASILGPPLCVHDPFLRLKVRVDGSLALSCSSTQLSAEFDGVSRSQGCGEVQKGMHSGQ